MKTAGDRPSRERPLARLWRFVAGLLVGLGVSPLAAASMPEAQPAQIPQAWLAYAERAGQSLSAWLSSDAPAALRLRATLDSSRTGPDRPPPPVSVAIWIGADGTVTRVSGPFPVDSSANADLQGLLVGHRLPSSPPADMLQPLRLSLQLEPAPAPSDVSHDSPPIKL
jgi:hypothetical protein